MGVRKARAAQTESALKEAARRQFAERGYLNTKITDITTAAGRATGSFYEHFSSKEALLQALLADMHGQARDRLADDEHPPHDLAAPGQLRDHLAVSWQIMRDNRPVMTALLEQAMTAGPASGALWDRLAQDTGVLREHLEYLRDQGRPLPGDPALIAAAMGGMLAMLASALLPAGPAAGPAGDAQTGLPAGAPEPRYADAEIVDSLARLLLHGLAGPPGAG
jgi:AcrR family transcriptional regulator